MIPVIFGFLIALAVGLTGIGGGSFTVPLLLVLGMPAAEAVGTTFVFAGVLRIIAAPFYFAAKQMHFRYAWLLIKGAVPGLVLGMVALKLLATPQSNPVVVIIIGIMLTLSSSITFIRRAQVPTFARMNSRWLPWLAFPIGIESGFSSAGAGALGTMLLMNYSEISPTEVVGTDLLFGLVLAVVGSAVHWTMGSVSTGALLQLLAGGIPGVILGCILSTRVPAQKLKVVVATVAICAGLQLMWSGVRAYTAKNLASATRVVYKVAAHTRP